jgi:hypothetical protein
MKQCSLPEIVVRLTAWWLYPVVLTDFRSPPPVVYLRHGRGNRLIGQRGGNHRCDGSGQQLLCGAGTQVIRLCTGDQQPAVNHRFSVVRLDLSDRVGVPLAPSPVGNVEIGSPGVPFAVALMTVQLKIVGTEIKINTMYMHSKVYVQCPGGAPPNSK